MFKTVVFLSVLFTIVIKVSTLECYACYDCETINDDYVISCESLLPSSSTSTTTSTSSTTTSPTTTTSTTPSTNTTTQSTTTSTTTSTSSTTTSPTTTTSTTPSTNTTTESTTTPTTTTSTTTTPTTTTSTESTTTNTTNSTTTTTTTTQAPFVEILERADISFECFSGIVHVNNSDKIVRGCAAGRTNETCEVFGLRACTFCSTDKCNGAGSVQSSVAVVTVLSIAYLFKTFY